jgi:ABC-type amino acid transport substrate-binding protein
MNDTSRPRVIATLEEYMRKLEWNQAKLAGAARVSPAQVASWFNTQQPRAVSKSHINRLAWAIADTVRSHLLANGSEDLSIMDHLDDLLNRLLNDAGYSAFTGAGEDLIWNRLSSERERSRRVLRTGWVDYPCFCARPADAPATDPPVGVAVDTMNVIAHLIGVELTWHQYEWSNVLDALAQREIDVVCPTLMELPRRLFQVRFSEPLPGIDVGMNVVVHKSTRKIVTDKIKDKTRTKPDVLVGFVEGEIGETLHRFVVPGIREQSFRTFQRAIDALRRRSEKDAIDCIVADHMICRGWVKKHHSELDLAFDPKLPTKRGLKLTVAAAINIHEPRLLTIIDDCMEIMKGYFHEIYESPSGDELRRAKVLDIKEYSSRGVKEETAV